MTSKIYLITGSTGALGQSILDHLTHPHASFILLGRNQKKLEEQKRQLKLKNIQCHIEVCDFFQTEAVKLACKRISDLNLVPDQIYNIAGIGLKGISYNESLDRQLEIIQLNIKALSTICLHFLPMMIQKKSGTIINISSTGAFQPSPGSAVYAATKSYVNSFSLALDSECKGTGVRILTVCPGPFVKAEDYEEFIKRSGLFRKQRTLTTDEVAIQISAAIAAQKNILVPGFFNAILAWISQHLNYNLVMFFVPLFVKGERLKKNS